MQRSTERGLIVLLLCLTAVYAIAEEVTLTTYYPSPRGVYEQLRTTGQTTLAEQSGNVGIGTAAPQQKLHVRGYELLQRQDAADGSTGLRWATRDGTERWSVQMQQENGGSDDLLFWRQTAPASSPTNWVTYMAHDLETGNVGIGTTTPQTRLALNRGVGGSDIGITQQQVGGANTMELTTADSAGNQATRLLLRGANDAANIEFYSGARGAETQQMSIDGTTGNVGIGTATPRKSLDVNGHIVAVNRVTLAQDTGTTTGTWHLDNSGGRFRIFNQPNIDTAGTERFTIDAATGDVNVSGNLTVANGRSVTLGGVARTTWPGTPYVRQTAGTAVGCGGAGCSYNLFNFASCDPGDTVISGGCQVDANSTLNVYYDAPSNVPGVTAWQCAWQRLCPTGCPAGPGDRAYIVTAICQKP